MEERIKEVMSSVFEIDVESINDNSSADNIELWDSLRHMNLILALEEEFGIELSDDDIGQILNFKLIKLIISEKLTTK